jgi:hypothetical protein
MKIIIACLCGQNNRVPDSIISHAAQIGPRGAITAGPLGYRCGTCKREFDGSDIARYLAAQDPFMADLINRC